jgi:hypothetical protein
MIRIAIDLELESDGTKTGDIIQLGYCIFETTTGEIVYSGGDYVKTGRPLHSFIIGLTKISDRDIQEGGISLWGAYYNMVQKWEEIRASRPDSDSFGQIIEWGPGDVSQLTQELEDKTFEKDNPADLEKYQERVFFIPFSNMESDSLITDQRTRNFCKSPFGRSSLNVKAVFQMYQEANYLKYSGGLKKSLGKLDMGFVSYKELVEVVLRIQ